MVCVAIVHTSFGPAGLWITTNLVKITGPGSGFERGIPNESNIGY